METQKLIEKAIKGHQNSFTSLLDKYWSEVFHFMLKRTENETEAEDITIETFSKAFSKLEQFNPDYQFNTWLIAIAKNVHYDLLRRNKNKFFQLNDQQSKMANSIVDETPTAEDNLIYDQHLSELLQYIKKLKPNYQEVIQLRYFHELSYQDIADQLNEPLSNIKVKLLRAKKLLAEIITSNTK